MIYAIIPLQLEDKSSFQSRLETLSQQKIPLYKEYDQVYFIDFEGTSKQVSDEVGFTSGETGSGIVLGCSAYWGFANKDLWEWLNLYSQR